MDNHIDVVLLIELLTKHFNLEGGTNDGAKQILVSNLLHDKPSVYIQDIAKIMYEGYRPSNKQYAHALSKLGYQPKGIAEYLNVSTATVSAHLKTPPKTYYNPHLEFLLMEQINQEKKNDPFSL